MNFTNKQTLPSMPDWHMLKNLVQEIYRSQSVQVSWAFVMLSCASFFLLYKFLIPNWTQLYSAQQSCMQVTKIARFDWSVAETSAVNPLSLRYIGVNRMVNDRRVSCLTGRCLVYIIFIVSCVCCEKWNFHEVASNFWRKKLCKFLVQDVERVSPV